MVAIELVEDRTTRAPLRLRVRDLDRLELDLRTREVLAFVDNPIMLAPPFVVTDREIDALVGSVAAAVEALSAHPPPAGPARRRGPS